MTTKYKDYFTENNFLEYRVNNMNDFRQFKLHNSIYNPYSENIDNILEEVQQYFLQGLVHKLVKKYRTKYCKTSLDNLIVPYIKNKNTIHDLIIVSDPRDAMRLATKHIKKLGQYEPSLMDSVLSNTDNANWKVQRSHIVTAFNPFPMLHNIIPISNTRAAKSINILHNLIKKTDNNIDINEFFLNETQAQLQLALFGLDDTYQKNNNKRIRSGLNGIAKRGTVRDYCLEIRKKIKNGDINGPLSKILRTLPEQSGTEIYANIIAFSFAGHDTTAHTLTWLIYELQNNIKIQLNLHKEIDIFWKEQGNKSIKISDFIRLPLLKRCIAETLRLWPAVANGTYRELMENDYIHIDNKRVNIPKGTYIQIDNITRHRSKKLWGDDVMKFNPNRDFTDNELWKDGFSAINMQSERYSPFTYNPRSCIGKSFSHIEMRIIMLHLLKNFTFIFNPHIKLDKSKIELNRATLMPRNPLIKIATNGLYSTLIPRFNSKL